MCGRKPKTFIVAAEHVEILRKHLASGKTERRIADRARILLLRAEGFGQTEVAYRLGRDPSTVWRVCQRYEARGLDALHDLPRSGRPASFSPSAACTNCRYRV